MQALRDERYRRESESKEDDEELKIVSDTLNDLRGFLSTIDETCGLRLDRSAAARGERKGEATVRSSEREDFPNDSALTPRGPESDSSGPGTSSVRFARPSSLEEIEGSFREMEERFQRASHTPKLREKMMSDIESLVQETHIYHSDNGAFVDRVGTASGST
jgi:hypothetical protein